MAFTLSQAGMVMHWKRKGGYPLRMFVNGLGAVATGITAIVVLVAKFVEGAWITALLIVVMILMMRAVKRHYVRVDRETACDRPIVPAEITEPIVVLPIDRWSRITEKALSFALSMSYDIRCLHVQTGEEPDEFCQRLGERRSRSAARRRQMRAQTRDSAIALPLRPGAGGRLRPGSGARVQLQKICVLVPELVVRHWWENLLHNRRADLLKVILLLRGNRRIVVINIPWYLERG